MYKKPRRNEAGWITYTDGLDKGTRLLRMVTEWGQPEAAVEQNRAHGVNSEAKTLHKFQFESFKC